MAFISVLSGVMELFREF